MITNYYLMLNTDFYEIKSEIKDYHYNFNYKIWTLIFNNGDVIFIYDKNIDNLTIINNEIGIVGYVVNKTLIKYDENIIDDIKNN